MIFKHLRADLGKQKINIDFREEKNQTLNSAYVLDVMHCLESLIIGDTVGYLQDYDRQYNCYYSKNEDSELSFDNNSSIKIANRRIYFNGTTPSIHCVRHIGNGEIRSTLLNNNIADAPNSVAMYRYSDALTKNQWVRCIEIVNSIIGADIVMLNSNKDLIFDFKSDYEYSIQAQQFIYTIVAECFLTPENYKRLVLLPKLDFLTTRQSLNLIKALGKLAKHELLITDLKVNPAEIREDDDIIITTL